MKYPSTRFMLGALLNMTQQLAIGLGHIRISVKLHAHQGIITDRAQPQIGSTDALRQPVAQFPRRSALVWQGQGVDNHAETLTGANLISRQMYGPAAATNQKPVG